MHRRFLKSAATVLGAAALIVAPMALLAPSANAAAIELNEDNADASVPFVKGPPPTGTNHVEYWVNFLAKEGVKDATCVKVDDVDKETWTIPAPPKDTKFVLVTSKAASENALEEEQNANLAWWKDGKAAQGNIVTAVDGKDISHVIWCTVPDKKTPPPSTPPVVDTDRVETTGAGANLGLVGAASALLIGAGAIVLGRRRQGAHR